MRGGGAAGSVLFLTGVQEEPACQSCRLPRCAWRSSRHGGRYLRAFLTTLSTIRAALVPASAMLRFRMAWMTYAFSLIAARRAARPPATVFTVPASEQNLTIPSRMSDESV